MKKLLLLLLPLGSALWLTAQQSASTDDASSKTHHVKKTKRKVSSEKIHYGTASFYANKFEGRQTSNGEIFSQNKLSAASNILPINQWVRVTNMRKTLWFI